MRTVKNKKELIEGIKAGERTFKIEGRTLYYQCKLVSLYQDATATDITSEPVDRLTETLGGGYIVAIIGIVVAGAVAILAILNKRGLTIELDGPVGKGTLTVS